GPGAEGFRLPHGRARNRGGEDPRAAEEKEGPRRVDHLRGQELHEEAHPRGPRRPAGAVGRGDESSYCGRREGIVTKTTSTPEGFEYKGRMTPHSPARLVQDLRALGVRAGDSLMVHASLRKIGPVQEGANGVIEALDAAVSPGGTLLMVLGARDDW